MSEKRVGIIAEGKTDFPIIEGALQAIFPDYTFVFTHIQPSETDLLGQTLNKSGFGWGGVYYACCNLVDRIELQRAAGTEFDYIVIHIDADVMISGYKEAGIEPRPDDLPLPCYNADESIETNCNKVESVITKWLGDEVPQNTALCIPCINTDTWAAFILFPELRDKIPESLLKDELEQFLLRMPANLRIMRVKAGKISKKYEKYELASSSLGKELWAELCNNYSQAKKFSKRVLQIDLVC